MSGQRLALLGPDIKNQFGLMQSNMQTIGASMINGQFEPIILNQIINGDGALMFLIRIAATNGGLIQRDGDQALWNAFIPD